MSRWLHSVNTILDKLDDTVDDIVAGDTVQNITKSAKKTFLRTQKHDDDESYEDESLDDEEEEDDDDDDGLLPPEQQEDPDDLLPITSSSDDHPNNNSSAEEGELSSFEAIERPIIASTRQKTAIPPSIPETVPAPLRRKKPDEKHNNKLESKLQALQDELQSTTTELRLVQAELAQASDMVLSERHKLDLEKSELLQEQEEEVQELHEFYKNQIDELRRQLQTQQQEFTKQLQSTVMQHKQTDASHSVRLNDYEQRQQETEQDLLQLQQTIDSLHTQQSEYITTIRNLEQKVQTYQDTARSCQQQASVAETKLDETISNHQRQLQMRMQRESQLEATIAELSQQRVTRATPSQSHNDTMVQSLQQQLEHAQTELTSIQSELHHSKLQNATLHQELTRVSDLHQNELWQFQKATRQYEQQLHDLQRRKQSETFPTTSSDAAELQSAKAQIATLSEQLLTAQQATELKTSEVLALQGRLQSALTRAEALEQQQPLDALELGQSSSSRRRKKTTQRSLRTALGLRSVRSRYGSRQQKCQEILGEWCDTLDAASTELMHTFRVEPMARLGLFLYLLLLHVWCFGLILYHTVQREAHGDLGTLTDRLHRHP